MNINEKKYIKQHNTLILFFIAIACHRNIELYARYNVQQRQLIFGSYSNCIKIDEHAQMKYILPTACQPLLSVHLLYIQNI